MRRYFIFALLSFLSCAEDSGKRKVVVYTNTPEGVVAQLAQLFETRYGIEVEAIMEGTSWLLTRLRAERRRPIADVFMGAAGAVPAVLAGRDGLLASYIPSGWEDLPATGDQMALRDSQWRWIGFGFASFGLVYSTAFLNPDEVPQTWDELIHPKWRGELTLWDPSVSGTATYFLVYSLERIRRRGGSEEMGWVYLRGFYKNLKKYAEEGPPAFLVSHGIVKLGVHLDNQFIYYRQKASHGKDSLRFHLPKDSPVLTNPIGLVAGAPHAEEGKLFIDFILSPDAQQILAGSFWVRGRDGTIKFPEGYPYGPLFAADRSRLREFFIELNEESMAAQYDRARIYWQNYIED